jgi:hypothetical protein
MSDARVRVSVVDGTIEVEGTEAFVTAQLEKYDVPIRAGLARVAGVAVPGTDGRAATDALSAIFQPTSTGVAILCEIPGNTKTERMVNAATLVAYGAATLKNRRSVLISELRAVCRAHRCYDQHNLVTVLRKRRTTFIIGGRGRRKTVALTADGMKAAERLIPTLGARSPLH